MSNLDSFKKKYGIYRDPKQTRLAKNKPITSSEAVKYLMTPVPKASDGYAQPMFGLDIKDGAIHQMDILFLPHEALLPPKPTNVAKKKARGRRLGRGVTTRSKAKNQSMTQEKSQQATSELATPQVQTKQTKSRTRTLVKPKNINTKTETEFITYKYALVICDVGSRRLDARPIESKKPHIVLRAIKEMYSGKYLRLPTSYVTTDGGTEFKGVVDAYFKQNKIGHRTTVAGNHKQTGIVERYNQLIGTALFHYQNTYEFETGEKGYQWVHELPEVIQLINHFVDKKWNNRKAQMKKDNFDNLPIPVCEKKDCELLVVGQTVHLALDRPIDVYSRKHIKGSENFRSTDLKWSPDLFKIKDVVLQPYQPPLYRVESLDGKVVENRLYSRQRLKLPL